MPSAATPDRPSLRSGARSPRGLRVARLAAVLAGSLFAAVRATAGVTVGECAQLAPRASGDVRMLSASSTSSMRVLAVLSTETSGPTGLRQPTADYWLSRFRGTAAKLGAEAVTGVQWIHFASRGRYFATALAVASAPEGAAAASCGRVVALEPIVNLCDAPEGLRASDEEALRLALGYSLGRKGYYLSSAEDTSSARVDAPLGLAVAIETVGGRPVAEGGPVRLRARLRDASGADRWSGTTVEEFQDLADIGGALLFGTLKSRSGYLLSAVDRMTSSFPVPPPSPAGGASAP